MTTQFTRKYPYESYQIMFDFTSELNGETIVSAIITAVDQATLVDFTSTILDGTKQSARTSTVYGWVQGGTLGHDYLITCRVVGSAGSQYELDGLLPVGETSTGGPTLYTLRSSIQGILQDAAFTDDNLTTQINDAVLNIAAGIRMPNGEISPPLPDLYTQSAVYTGNGPFVALPPDYQRNVFYVYDNTNYQILPPRGGNYYSFNRFLKQINNMDFSEGGDIYRVCVKGNKLYYQGIPSASTLLGIHYYRKPTLMALDDDTPDAFASVDHLTTSLIKHYCLMNIYGDMIEAGVAEPATGMKYHTTKFYSDMQDLIDFVGVADASPQYYGTGETEDRGICD